MKMYKKRRKEEGIANKKRRRKIYQNEREKEKKLKNKKNIGNHMEESIGNGERYCLTITLYFTPWLQL